jgi:hypothetical protein
MKVIKYGMTEVDFSSQVEKSDGSSQEKIIIHQDNTSADMISHGKAKPNCFKKEVGVNYPRLLREHDWKYNWVMKELDQRDPSNRGMLKINISIICGGKYAK